jgi:hypothetical protein
MPQNSAPDKVCAGARKSSGFIDQARQFQVIRVNNQLFQGAKSVPLGFLAKTWILAKKFWRSEQSIVASEPYKQMRV